MRSQADDPTKPSSTSIDRGSTAAQADPPAPPAARAGDILRTALRMENIPYLILAVLSVMSVVSRLVLILG
jgi:hypothetical protein